MKSILIISVILILSRSVDAQVVPANGNQISKDSLTQTKALNSNVDYSSKWITTSDSMGKSYYIRTKAVSVDSLWFSFGSVNDIVSVKCGGNAPFISPIGERDKMIFTFADEKNISVRSLHRNQQGYESAGDSYSHGYKISVADLKKLANKHLKTIFITNKKAFITLQVSESSAQSFQQLAAAFFLTMKKKVLHKQ